MNTGTSATPTDFSVEYAIEKPSNSTESNSPEQSTQTPSADTGQNQKSQARSSTRTIQKKKSRKPYGYMQIPDFPTNLRNAIKVCAALRGTTMRWWMIETLRKEVTKHVEIEEEV